MSLLDSECFTHLYNVRCIFLFLFFTHFINYIYKTSIKPYHYFTDALSFALPSTMKNPHTQLLGKTQDRGAMAGSDKGYQAGETHKAGA